MIGSFHEDRAPADPVIPPSEMFAPLLRALPSFAESWDRFAREWPRGERLYYLALAELARHLVDLLGKGETHAFAGVFRVVERWHTEGDAYVREAATVGLLEGLQNLNLHRSTHPSQFREFLGTESVRAWDKLIQFWDGKPLTEQ